MPEIDVTDSVSKGVFVFKKNIPKKLKSRKSQTKHTVNELQYCNELWYHSYRRLWDKVQSNVEDLNDKMFSAVLKNLIHYVKNSYAKCEEFLPTAALMTGINLPDHGALFTTLSLKIKSEVTPHVALLYSEDSSTLKSLVENMISQFINGTDSDIESDEDLPGKKIKKNVCNFSVLEVWYETQYPWELDSPKKSPTKKRKLKRNKKNLVIVLPDFESFQQTVLQNFIMILNSYMKNIPIVLVFGVATSVETLHRMLPFHVSSKLNIQVFHSQQSIIYLNEVLNTIFLNEHCPFQLSGKVFTFLTDVFLFYDFSVKGFIQGLKFAMFQHFYENNAKSLCCAQNNIKDVLKNFTSADLEDVRHLISFRKFVEEKPNNEKIKLLIDDNYFKDCLEKELHAFHKYLSHFYVVLRCLHILVSRLPKQPLGKQLREIYCQAVSKNITETTEFNESIQLLNFLSKDELIDKIECLKMSLKCFVDNINDSDEFKSILEKLNYFHIKINESTLDVNTVEITNLEFDSKLSRAELKEKLLERSKQQKSFSMYEIARSEFLEFITDIMKQYLKSPKSLPFHEIFLYEDLLNLRPHIVGAPRAGIHTALNNPQYYLQCTCCNLPDNNSILPTLPDVCIVYKLHLECGKLINMYDLLLAFVSIVEPDIDIEEGSSISQELQARFTRAVAELQFLGFIKTSKKKIDHVMRLTWGTSA